ncbi:MAG: DNA-binding protein [Proteobacteria bacterium]|nr:MAG: DNA-binding protein [Pseudomonadota bacterium]
MTDEVLTIKDVAAILKLAEKTVYAMANEGELPAFKVRGQWRIRKVDFDRWMEAQAKAAGSTPPKEGE